MRITDPDVETWLGYVSRLETEFLAHAGYGANLWQDTWAGQTDFERVMTGPWHIVRAHVTTELREWFDEYDTERVTLTEWRKRMREEREREYFDWLDNQPF